MCTPDTHTHTSSVRWPWRLKGSWERQGLAKQSGNMMAVNNKVLIIGTTIIWLHIRTKRGGG